MAGFCLNCGKRTKQSASYCCDSCRSAVRRLRLRLDGLPPSVGHLFDLLCDFGPIEATGYRLLYNSADGLWVFPRRDRHEWISVDEGTSYRSAFRLRPFEIPSVDTAGRYGVQFVRWRRVLSTPTALLSGVYLVPVLAAPSPGQRLI